VSDEGGLVVKARVVGRDGDCGFGFHGWRFDSGQIGSRAFSCKPSIEGQGMKYDVRSG
jgi:hypothetical protein